MLIYWLMAILVDMPSIYFPEKFVVRCQRYIEKNPDLADSVDEFVARCGRLGLKYLQLITTEEEKTRCNPLAKDKLWNPFVEVANEGGSIEVDSIKHRDGKVRVNLPDKDYKRVEELVVKKLGITATATAWYMLCVFTVMMGYWQLPPKV